MGYHSTIAPLVYSCHKSRDDSELGETRGMILVLPILWEVTEECNLNCIHRCATAPELLSPTNLPSTIVPKLIMQASQSLLPIPVLSGGGPPFRHDSFDLEP